MSASNSVTPETLSKRKVINNGEMMLQPPPADSAINHRPHQTQHSPK